MMSYPIIEQTMCRSVAKRMTSAPLIKHLRAILRLITLCFVTACVYLFWMTGALFVCVSEKAARKWRSLSFRAWARAVARITRMKVNLIGTPPRGSFFLVSNHLSYMDIAALAAHLDGVFIAKSEVARWPLIGRLCRSMNTILIDRRRHRTIQNALGLIEQSIETGGGVVLFAEGTSTRGRVVAPFKPSLLELAARRKFPVHFASVSYRTPAGDRPAHRAVCWWGEMSFARHFYRMLQLTEFEASLSFGAQTVQSSDRKELALKLWSAVNAQFIPVV